MHSATPHGQYILLASAQPEPMPSVSGWRWMGGNTRMWSAAACQYLCRIFGLGSRPQHEENGMAPLKPDRH